MHEQNFSLKLNLQMCSYVASLAPAEWRGCLFSLELSGNVTYVGH